MASLFDADDELPPKRKELDETQKLIERAKLLQMPGASEDRQRLVVREQARRFTSQGLAGLQQFNTAKRASPAASVSAFFGSPRSPAEAATTTPLRKAHPARGSPQQPSPSTPSELIRGYLTESLSRPYTAPGREQAAASSRDPLFSPLQASDYDTSELQRQIQRRLSSAASSAQSSPRPQTARSGAASPGPAPPEDRTFPRKQQLAAKAFIHKDTDLDHLGLLIHSKLVASSERPYVAAVGEDAHKWYVKHLLMRYDHVLSPTRQRFTQSQQDRIMQSKTIKVDDSTNNESYLGRYGVNNKSIDGKYEWER